MLSIHILRPIAFFCAVVAFCSWPRAEVLSEQDTHESAAQTVPAVVPSADCKNNFRVALDVGHTPQLPGTLTARGSTEYEFNLALANFIRSTLVDRGYQNVFLINMSGGLETLQRRDIEANRLKADLFVSIHHDSVQESYLKSWVFNGRQLQYNDEFSGYSLFVSEKNPNWPRALDFAVLLSDQLLSGDMHFTLHHAEQEKRELLDKDRGIYRYDDLIVLKEFDGPAVLLEAGVVVNREEELISGSLQRHQLISDAMFRAIEKFCELRRVLPHSQ